MNKTTKLIMYLLCSGILITASLYAGRNAYKHCDKCHYSVKKDSTDILNSLSKAFQQASNQKK